MLVSGGGGEVVVFHINFSLHSRIEIVFFEHFLKLVIFKASERESVLVNLYTGNVSRQKT